jgi:flagellum-specific ATP synthase
MFDGPRITGISSLLDGPVKAATGFRSVGRIARIVGLTVQSIGPAASIGDMVAIRSSTEPDRRHLAEVVGFLDDRILLFPIEGVEGIRNGDCVSLMDEGFTIPVGEGMLGRVIDGLGRPIDRDEPLPTEHRWKIRRAAPNSMQRRRIDTPFITGVKSIDSTLMCGCGQRMGIFAGSGVGKSTLLGMICRNSSADLNVIALIGERGKEVLDFIEESLGPEGLRRSVVIVSTSDRSPLERIKGAESAMAIAEYFRDQGRDVLFVMDSVTRYAMAQREIGLAIGEPPATRGYPPSVFSLLPSLLERAGTSQSGSITGFFTVLVEGDDLNDPVGDTTRSILDGHIVLSRELASAAHYPSIDVLQSVSRVMSSVAAPDHVKLAQELRKLMAAYHRAEDMINIGAYKPGSNPEIDRAIEKRNAINQLLCQGVFEKCEWSETFRQMKQVFGR